MKNIKKIHRLGMQAMHTQATSATHKAKDGITIDELPLAKSMDETMIFEAQQENSVAVSLGQLKDALQTQNKKYAIICVAGQSNAVGYDESPVIPEFGTAGIDFSRIKQLGFIGEDNLNLIPLGHCAQNFQDMRYAVNPHSPDYAGTKGMHLPLAMAMLKYVPADTDILILPCAYGGTGFNSGADGSYDANAMRPSADARRWGVGKPLYQAMRDRVQYALDLNAENTFLGVVWVQGENDKAKVDDHKIAFEALSADFLQFFNDNGYAQRVKKQTWDRDLWFNMETVSFWYTDPGVAAIWALYQAWNPASYVPIPRDADSNATSGTGETSSTLAAHFGNDAYANSVVPILSRMLARFNFPHLAPQALLAKETYIDSSKTYGVITQKNTQDALIQLTNKLCKTVPTGVSIGGSVMDVPAKASSPNNQWIVSSQVIIPADSPVQRIRFIARPDVPTLNASTESMSAFSAADNTYLGSIAITNRKEFKNDLYGGRPYVEIDLVNTFEQDIFLGFRFVFTTKTFNARAYADNTAYVGELSMSVGDTLPAFNSPFCQEYDLIKVEEAPSQLLGHVIAVNQLKQLATDSADYAAFKAAILDL